MKKVLLSSAAVLGLVAFTPAANAQDGGLSLDVGGHFKGYGLLSSQDENNGKVSSIDMLRETEVHLTGETTLDNGLTVGAHIEAEADREMNGANTEGFAVDESYAYFAGGWGRVNLGNEDGANYLLQVAAPSADSNIDGVRQFIQPVNYNSLANVGANTNVQFDYANDFATEEDKFTYLTPSVQGFQAGVSYTPDVQSGVANALQGPNLVDRANNYDSAWDLAARYEGEVDKLGFNLGAGYTHSSRTTGGGTNPAGGLDDLEEWNIGADFDWGPFGLGAVYTENNNGNDTNDTDETWVIGADYTTGPFKVGASYFNNEDDNSPLGVATAGNDVETDRYTGGVNYSFGPGVSFRGSVSYIDHELSGGDTVPGSGGDDSAEATSILLGTQVNF